MDQFEVFTLRDFAPANRSMALDPVFTPDALRRSVIVRMLEELPDGIAIAKAAPGSVRLLYANEAFVRLTGYRTHEVLRADVPCARSDRSETAIDRIGQPDLASETLSVALRKDCDIGATVGDRLGFKAIEIDGERFYLGILCAGSESRQPSVVQNNLAHIDAATGCLNRQAFVAAVDRCFSTHRGRMLVVKLDVIGFHDVNAGYGFDVGDALLLETGRRLRETDATLVARMGANEFALAFELAGEIDGSSLALDVADTLAPDFIVPGANISLRFAIGYAVNEPGANAVSLLRNAGTALRAAKEDPFSGPRGFRPADAEDACKRVRMTRELKVAIANDEFVHHFQPQIDLATGACVGAEALIRWNHPLFGSQSPARFIEAAERTGLLLDLGERGLARVAAFARRINAHRTRALRFSVNVSAIEFLHRDMADVMERVLLQTNAQPNWLTLEITESKLLDNTPHVLEAFRRLRNLGIGLSVDDFGTGYSSFRLLETFPVTEIKIDRSFVGDFATNPSKQVIVRAIVELGRALQIEVVAEGIETETQREWLSAMGCPIGQGYLFGVPADSQSFADRYGAD
jgi:diguanylate cyclase (GGDEF)-like protein